MCLTSTTVDTSNATWKNHEPISGDDTVPAQRNDANESIHETSEQSSKRNKLIQNTQSTEESITNLVAAMGRLRIDEDEMEEGGADDLHELVAAMGRLRIDEDEMEEGGANDLHELVAALFL